MKGPTPADRQQGVTLVEVLVALVIVAVGVLALTALQVVSKRNTLDAAMHSDAASLAHNLLERMRGNASIDALDRYRNLAALGLGNGQMVDQPVCTAAEPCSPQQLAGHDLREWEALLDGRQERIGAVDDGDFTGGLDDGRACLTGPNGGGSGFYTLTIAWRGGIAIPTDPIDPDDPDGPDCGRGLGLYGDNDELRRSLQLQTFIAAR
jgi:type IV pilus assembly protein PilV